MLSHTVPKSWKSRVNRVIDSCSFDLGLKILLEFLMEEAIVSWCYYNLSPFPKIWRVFSPDTVGNFNYSGGLIRCSTPSEVGCNSPEMSNYYPSCLIYKVYWKRLCKCRTNGVANRTPTVSLASEKKKGSLQTPDPSEYHHCATDHSRWIAYN